MRVDNSLPIVDTDEEEPANRSGMYHFLTRYYFYSGKCTCDKTQGEMYLNMKTSLK